MDADKVFVDKPAETQTVYHIADANSPAVKNLQAAAGVLQARRRDIEDRQMKFGLRRASSCNQGFCPPLSPSDIAEQKTLKEDHDKYDELRDLLTFQYPILDRAADWDKGSVSALGDIANSKSAQDLADTLGARVAGNLADIKRTREGLANGAINIWRLKPLTDLASRQFQAQTASNPARKRLLSEKIADEQPHLADAILEGVALLVLNLAAIALSPVTGGISLGVAAAVNVGLAAKHTIDYIYEDSLAGSDLRRAQALSASDPSLFWLAVEIVGAAVDVGTAVAAMKALGPLAKAAQLAKGKAAVETAEAIQTTARQLGKPALAERILAKAGNAEAAVLEAAGATADEVKALTKISASVEKEVGETLGTTVKTAAGADVKVSKAGYLFSCSSPCVILREKYASIISKDQQVLDKLVKLEQDGSKVASARQAAMAAQDGKALAKADAEVARIKQAAKELEDAINVKYLKPVSVEGEEAAAQALKKV